MPERPVTSAASALAHARWDRITDPAERKAAIAPATAARLKSARDRKAAAAARPKNSGGAA